MKRMISLVLLSSALALGSVSVYSVDPVDMAHSAFVNRAEEGIVATSDTATSADVFLGHQPPTGAWQVVILDENGAPQGTSQDSVSDSLQYSFVHFTFSPGIALQKGSNYFLQVKHSQDSLAQVFWNPNGLYPYGHVTLTGTSLMPPAPGPNCNLAARITGANRVVDSSFFGVQGGMEYYGAAPSYPAPIHQLLTYMNDLGIKWSREGIHWEDMAPDSGEFHFQYFDAVVESAAQHGVSIMPMVGYCPE